MKHGIIKDGKVINVIEIDDQSEWETPAGTSLGPEGGEIGDTHDQENDIYISQIEKGLSDLEQAESDLIILDMVLSRAEEDIVNVLISKNVASLADFGPTLEKRYNDKAAARVRKNEAEASNPDEPVIILPD